MKKPKLLTLNEFKELTIKTKNEIDSHLIDYLYETMGNFTYKTPNGAELQEYIALEVSIPKTESEWVDAYNFYYDSY